MEVEDKKVLLDLIQGAESDDPGVLRSWTILVNNENLWQQLENFKSLIAADLELKYVKDVQFDEKQQKLFDAHLQLLKRNLELWLQKVQEAINLVENK